ncbi:hypothetical protein SLE2022_282450 [Rubroshorea leprosula]
MANFVFHLQFYISFICMLSICLLCRATDEGRKVHIVYMGSLIGGKYSPMSQHLSLLKGITGNDSAANFLIRSYGRSFNGFAANLTEQEVKELASMKEVVSVFPSIPLQLHTTRSWDFLGLTETIKRNTTIESDIIIGVIDSGIWPESESFNDKGFGPPPKKWKGVCHGGKNFTCNNKIIGARYYTPANSTRDYVGHGTHTASIAAGNPVTGASFFGLAQGTARGGVPSARIAAYKVCDEVCNSEDLLAAFDDAIADGVDLMTISLGAVDTVDFFQDTMAIGAFHAMQNGILTINSAGNSGIFGPLFTTSISPWMLSVAASSTDRLFISNVALGNGNTLRGFAINSFSLNGTKFPLIHGKDASFRNCSKSRAKLCRGCLDSNAVKGKIVLCDEFDGIVEAKKAGAVGSVLLNDAHNFVADIVSLPASALSKRNYSLVMSYLNSTKNSVAEILRTEAINEYAAPLVAPFSSLGPNYIVPDVLKPDLSAPGVDILAAYSPIAPPSDDPSDQRRVKYNILSGTSMSCPHAAALAAYVKTFHSDWSPSAIKSALMTTASPMNRKINPYSEIAYGSGHINPVNAVDPGLVYEALKEDYIKLLCSIGYKSDLVRRVSGDNSSCPEASHNVPARDLNYPSLAAQVPAKKPFTVQFHRTVTNVGTATSTYKAEMSPNSNLTVTVVPAVLSFKSLNEKKSFNVTVTGNALTPASFVSTDLVWSDGNHKVRSPIVIHTFQSINSTDQAPSKFSII